MNWDWSRIKEQAKEYYAKGSQLLVFLEFCFYLLACVVAAKPVTPRGYIGFAWHTFQWREPERASAAPAVRGAAPAASRPSSTPAPKISCCVRATRKLEVKDSREPGAGVVAVLEPGTPVRVMANFRRGITEIQELVENNSHSPAHGYVQNKYLEYVEDSNR